MVNRWLIALFLVFIGVGAWRWKTNVPSPHRMARMPASDQVVPDACERTSHCVVTYVAPWCPACHQMVPQMTRLRDAWEKDEKIGVKFVVGKGEPLANDQMAKSIGKSTWVDVDGSFAAQMRVQHFPTVWIIDKSGKVIARDRAAFDWINALSSTR